MNGPAGIATVALVLVARRNLSGEGRSTHRAIVVYGSKRHRGIVDKRAVLWHVRMIGFFTACGGAVVKF